MKTDNPAPQAVAQTPPTLEGMAVALRDAIGHDTDNWITMDRARRYVAALSRSPAVAPGVPAGVGRDLIRLLDKLAEVATDALGFYANEEEWSGKPWRLTFNSSIRDADGFSEAKEAWRECAELHDTLKDKLIKLATTISPDAQAGAGQAPTPAVGGVALPGTAVCGDTGPSPHPHRSGLERALEIIGRGHRVGDDTGYPGWQRYSHGEIRELLEREIERLVAAMTGDAQRGIEVKKVGFSYDPSRAYALGELDGIIAAMEPAPATAPAQARFALGDCVRKAKGSSWHGRVVGFYSTNLTPIGCAVESEREPGSVQIYPEAALEAATAPAQAPAAGRDLRVAAQAVVKSYDREDFAYKSPHLISALRTALAAPSADRGGATDEPQQPQVPEGWVLVPKWPTVEMRSAGSASRNIIGDASPIYRAMIAMAPTPPSTPRPETTP